MTTHEDAVAMVSLVYAARAAKRDAETSDKILTAALKQYLQDSGDLDVYDGESRLTASLQERQLAGSLDLAGMAEENPDLLRELALMGVLSADLKALGANGDAAVEAALYLRAGGKSYALTVKAEK
jgi:hypothetical protein